MKWGEQRFVREYTTRIWADDLFVCAVGMVHPLLVTVLIVLLNFIPVGLWISALAAGVRLGP